MAARQVSGTKIIDFARALAAVRDWMADHANSVDDMIEDWQPAPNREGEQMADKPMTADEYRDILAALGWTQGQASRWLDVDARTGRRYATGELAIPTFRAAAMRVAARHPQIIRWIDSAREG